MDSTKGKLNWIFCDGDLPPKDGGNLEAHEALMVVNLQNEEADIELQVLFEEREPVEGIKVNVPSKRVKCFRLDQPLGNMQFVIPQGQYALVLTSSVPVFAVFGRLDTRQSNLAYYPVQGHSF
jgi:hypothetical protein